MKLLGASTPDALLAGFEEFIESANRLEVSHRRLQDEVARLRLELEQRNNALERSLNEVESTRKILFHTLEALPCGVVLAQGGGLGTIVANTEAQRLLGMAEQSKSELPKPIREMMRPWSSEVESATLEQEVCIEGAGQTRWLSVKATRVTFAVDGPAKEHRLLILEDISGRKAFEREREQARNSLALAEMSSVLAHEIRNPLGAMELFLSLLSSQESLSPDAVTWVGHLTAGVRNLSAIVNNVLQFYSTGTLQMSRIPLDVVIEESASFLAPVASESGMQLWRTGDLRGVEVIGDAQALRQVILNLCCNAFRHSQEGGVVTIDAAAGGSTIRIEVADQGTGIAPEALPYIFDAGFSGTGRTSGLGLAVCKRIVQAHGGTLGVNRNSSEGTTMYLEIPAL